MGQYLADKVFFVGNKYSMANITLYAYTHCAGEGGFNLGACPATREWLTRVGMQAGYVPMVV